ncbi:MAG TPA: hypothetical protein VHF27_01355 [Acidimicrobiales bacterium]|nr:hypothetical protein [Acidimicrobiales bacterium]
MPFAALAGALSAGAGLVHAAAAGSHAGEDTAVLLFALTAVVQVVVGGVAFARPSRPVLVAAALVNLAVVGAWALSRTSGLPIDGFREPEAVGLQDLTATVLEGLGAVAALVALAVRPRPLDGRRLVPVLVLAVVPALVGISAPHGHPTGAGHGHDEVAAQHGHGEPAELAADPIFAGADTSHASADELQAARRLIEATRTAVATRFPDQGSLLAAGYRSIGDGLVTPYDHFVKAEYLDDGRELDPDRVESIVMERTPEGWRVASAMYILEVGKTMADVPDVAGALTVWHDHQNLCWDRSGVRLAGLLVNGRCFPAGTFQPTPPMLHVWLADHPCGPFAGIEGHGGGCTHGHGS